MLAGRNIRGVIRYIYRRRGPPSGGPRSGRAGQFDAELNFRNDSIENTIVMPAAQSSDQYTSLPGIVARCRAPGWRW